MSDPQRAAETHLEVYRPFEGRLRPHPFAPWPVVALGVRVALKRRLALILLYAFPLIATIVFSFFVYARYAVSGEMLGQDVPAMLDLVAKQAMKNFEVRTQIAEFLSQVQSFALLTAAWYGSGLIAEDIRAGAHQLWFARPLGRGAYAFARFLTVSFFSALAVLVPGLVICLVAAVNSPDWSFLRDEGDVVWRSLLYSSLWIATTGLVALAVSCLVRKRAWALMAFFAVFLAPHACGMVLGHGVDRRWYALSPLNALRGISEAMLDLEPHRRWLHVSTGLDATCIAVLCVVSALVVVWRLRRVEVVA